MGQKTINLFLAGFILFGSVLSYHFYETSALFDFRKEFRRNLAENYHNDSLLVVSSDVTNDGLAVKKLEASGFYIEVLRGDTLLFWNKEVPASIQMGTLYKSFRSGRNVYRFYFPSDNVAGVRSSKWDIALFCGWFMGLFLLIIAFLHWVRNSLFWNDKMRRFDVIWISSVTLLLFLLPGYFTADQLFQNSAFFGVKYSDDKIQISLWQFALLALLLLFTSVLSQSDWFKSKFPPLKPNVRYLTGTFIIALIVYYLIAVSELFILDGNLVVNIEEAMNFGVSEFFFYGLSLGHLFIVVYLAKRLFSKTETTTKGWEKSLYISVAILSVTIGFILFGFTTNTIGIVLFLMVLFLLLDLYFEYFEINVSFY
ncbi:MAG: hypothetical protein IPK46_08425 [Saprospiraceae bacterium]|nr:hypothetical protein [Saprospiraceae bacterium]